MIGVLLLGGAMPAAAFGWSRQRVPVPVGAGESAFAGVSCTSASACTVVGSYENRQVDARPLIERWDGRHWHRQQAIVRAQWVEFGVGGVSCSSRHACTAVGDSVGRDGCTTPVVERWNGTRWSIQPTPRAVRCTFRRFGFTFKSSAILSRVSCSSVRLCTAVGDINVLGGGSGSARSASGSETDKPLIERWSHGTWRIQHSRFADGPVDGVSCPSRIVCAAATNGALGRWRAGAWSAKHVNAYFNDLNCPDVQSCFAVGYDFGAHGENRLLVERWHRGRWRLERPPHPRRGSDPEFSAVSCPRGSSACTGVGMTILNRGGIGELPFAERRVDGRWRRQAISAPAHASSTFLSDISCLSPKRCIVVGSFDPAAGAQRPLADVEGGV